MLCDDDDLLLKGHMGRILRRSWRPRGSSTRTSKLWSMRGMRPGRSGSPDSRRLFAYTCDLAEMRRFSTFVSSGCLYRKELHDGIGKLRCEHVSLLGLGFFPARRCMRAGGRVPAAACFTPSRRAAAINSNNFDSMRGYLDKLSAKHDLGPLPRKTFICCWRRKKFGSGKRKVKFYGTADRPFPGWPGERADLPARYAPVKRKPCFIRSPGR